VPRTTEPKCCTYLTDEAGFHRKLPFLTRRAPASPTELRVGWRTYYWVCSTSKYASINISASLDATQTIHDPFCIDGLVVLTFGYTVVDARGFIGQQQLAVGSAPEG
jgi:hypothetical protein